MKVTLDINRDIRTLKTEPGGYEWWHFNAISDDGEYRFVVTFYEGNPFSTRYIKRLNKGTKKESLPENFPAVNISFYENNEPVFYNFTEYEPEKAIFSDNRPDLTIGSNKMSTDIDDSEATYILNLKDKLPNGDAIVGNLEFSSKLCVKDLLDEDPDGTAKHSWSLIQPKAEVSGKIRIYSRNEKPKIITFAGIGYHDHNLGFEPMKNDFSELYRGRYHFEYGTLIYYIIKRKEGLHHRAWIISNSGDRLLNSFEDISLMDKSLSLFGLVSARKFLLHSGNAHVNIQQSKVLDNGPFYQRFSSDAFLHVPENDAVEVSNGFSEYVCTDRIHWPMFRPLINMRIRYRSRPPHWIQYSKKLYRWIW